MSHSTGSISLRFRRFSRFVALLSISLLTQGSCYATELIIPKYTSTTSLPFIIGLLALGVLLGLLAYTLFLAISTKEPMFIYFSVIMLLLTVLQTFSTYDRFIFSLTYNRVTIITHLLFITFLLFFEDFFALAIHAPKLSKFNQVSIFIIGGYVLFFLLLKALFPQVATLHLVLNFIRELFVFYTNIIFIYTIIRAIQWLKREAIIMLIAFIPPALLTSINAMNIFPFMQNYQNLVTFLMQYNQPIGLSLQAILFSLAMGNRYNRIKMARQQSFIESERLRKLDQEKTEFFMDVSHELRTPLTIILGMCQQLRQGKYGDSIHHNDRILETIERNSLRLLKQVSHLLQLEKPIHHLHSQDIVIHTVLQNLVGEFSEIAKNKKISLSFQAAKNIEEFTLAISQENLETVVLNLLSNAIKFTPEGGSVLISAEITDTQTLHITVQDSGLGIAKTDLTTIFDRYFHGKTGSKQGQTGLGLALVKHIMEGYGGAVTVESQIHKGSTFHLYFPPNMIKKLDHKEKEPHIKSGTSVLYTSDFSPVSTTLTTCANDKLPTVLIVEDNVDMATYIASILTEHYRVFVASSGQEGLEIVEREQIDLIISDIMMPKMDGHAFLIAMRQLTATRPIPLIFLTARDALEEKIDSIRSGAVNYITKPFDKEMLLVTISGTLAHDRELIETRIEHLRAGIDLLLQEVEHPSASTLSESHRAASNKFIREHGYSEREVEVFVLILAGKSDKEIASMLDLSVRTVANHNRRLYQKAQVHNRYELISKVWKL